jgi:hypothetical protein
MAQKNKILVPVSFEFRLTKLQWGRVPGYVTGWRKEKGIDDPRFLDVKLNDSSTRSVRLTRLPQSLQKKCLATVGKSNADLRVNQICSEFEVSFLHHEAADLPIGGSQIRKTAKPADAWRMRRDFLRVKPNQSFRGFLSKWGRWKQFQLSVEEGELVELQRVVREALTSSPDKWLSSGLATISGSGVAGLPFTMLTDECYRAICATTTFDLLRKRKFKKCALPDCGAPYEAKANKAFCSQACAHLDSVRKSRKAAKAKQPHK